MQRFAKEAGIAATDYCEKKWFHLYKAIGQAEAQRFGNARRAAYCIPPKPRFFDFEAVRQSILGRGDVNRDARARKGLLQREASLF